MSVQYKPYLGWQLDVSAAEVQPDPVCLKLSGLKAHTAIVAQSGSGKSFALGRLVEEVVSCTRARFLIFDPNSDFLRLSEIESDVWEHSPTKEALAWQDTLARFTNRWQAIGVEILTHRGETNDLHTSHPRTVIDPISLVWSQLAFNQKVAILGFTVQEDSEEIYALRVIEQRAHQQWQMEGRTGQHPLNAFRDAGQEVWRLATLQSRTEILLGASLRAVRQVLERTEDILSWHIWDIVDQPRSIQSQVSRLLDPDDQTRVIVLDLASVASHDVATAVADAALETLWNAAWTSWGKAISLPASCDRRTPTFIVIDEAHNLGPAQTQSPSTRSVTDKIVRVAAEGRKYGLFLIVVSQRPSRLHPSILSQCDNLLLMRMNNRLDLEFVQANFGFLPEEWASQGLTLNTGEAIAAGRFVDQPITIRIAPRRTAEGGRNLRDAYWTADPLEPIT